MRSEAEYRAILIRRLVARPTGPIDIQSKLRHFALINYALPKSRLEPFIPNGRFEIPEFTIAGQPMALMSAVPFVDVDFHFMRLFPFLKFYFGQTNYRVYVIDKKSQEHAVWFFGTTLGSPLVYGARSVWKIPWHYAHYQIDCRHNSQLNRYTTYSYAINSEWGNAIIDLEDSGEPVSLVEGFASTEEMKLILTHPVDGYFNRLDNKVGGYSVWHEEIPVTMGHARNLYFSLYERLGLLSREEMQHPHSIFICPETEFKIFMPPKIIAK